MRLPVIRLALILLAPILLLTAARGEGAGTPGHHKEVSWPAVQVWRQPQGLPQNSVYSILQSRDGYLWIGTRGGVSRFDGVRFTTFDDSKQGQLTENEVWSLAEGGDGSIWIATYGGGVTRFKDGTFTVYTKADGLLSNFVARVHTASDGAIWISGDGGVSRFHEGRFTNLTVRDGLTHEITRGLYTDTDGSIWIGTYQGGIHRYTNGRLVTERFSGTMPTAEVVSFYRDKKHSLWIAALDGLFKVTDGRITRYTTEHGLPSSSVRFVAEGEGDTIWIGTTDGLARYENGAFTSYNLGDDWRSPDFSALCVDR